MIELKWIEIGDYLIKTLSISYIKKTENKGIPEITVFLNNKTVIPISYSSFSDRDRVFTKLSGDLV